MVCSCFFFQRVLVGCRCILAVKNRVVDVYEDVFWHHLIKYSLGLLPFCERRIDDGLMNGPGVSGVDPKQLQVAIEQTPASRDGVNAWIREGGLSWAPNSRVVWEDLRDFVNRGVQVGFPRSGDVRSQVRSQA